MMKMTLNNAQGSRAGLEFETCIELALSFEMLEKSANCFFENVKKAMKSF